MPVSSGTPELEKGLDGKVKPILVGKSARAKGTRSARSGWEEQSATSRRTEDPSSASEDLTDGVTDHDLDDDMSGDDERRRGGEADDEEEQGDVEVGEAADNLHGARIHVVVRKRPAKSDDSDVVTCAPPTVNVHEPRKKVDLTEVRTHSFSTWKPHTSSRATARTRRHTRTNLYTTANTRIDLCTQPG